VARKQKPRRAPGSAPPPPRPPGQGGGGGWTPLRDAVRKDIEQAVGALAFATTLHERLESQRRLFADFPRVMEQLRSGALERVAVALTRLFEGKEQFDLTRFLRDLPLALGQLAAAEARRSAPPPPPSPRNGEAHPPPNPSDTSPASQVAGTHAVNSPAASAPPPPDREPATTTPDAPAASATPTAAPASIPPASAISGIEGSTPASPLAVDTAASVQPALAATPPDAPGSTAGAPSEPPSPRVELRSRLLAAAPQLQKAVITYRRTVATVRRAASPRRAPGPWRSDREVLEEAQSAVDFARQMFDAYASAWADQPVQPGLGEGTSAEADRFLAWTQLARYVELAGPRPAASAEPAAAEAPQDEEASDRPVAPGEAQGATDAGA
jgi:hypothetical protein